MNINYIGIPSYIGSLYSGTELTPEAFRAYNFKESFPKNCKVIDLGNVPIPDYLPRHNVPPIRNYPGSNILWESIRKFPSMFEDKEFSLIIGGDCSIIVGTSVNLFEKFGEDIHIIVIDAHIDSVKPNANSCIGAAAMGLWFLTNDNIVFEKPEKLSGKNFTVVGCQSGMDETNIETVPLTMLREVGIEQCVSKLLSKINQSTKILIHFDVDVICEQDMPAAYAPSKEGLTYEECSNLLRGLIKDDRVVGLEVTEFSALKDSSGKETKRLMNMLVNAISSKLTVPIIP